jgi:two-component system, NarL family, nitrate/nitrite response regulator NarL
MSGNDLTILLGDRHPLFLEAVRSVLEREAGLRVVATAGEGNGAVAEAGRHRPHVALLSANLVDGDRSVTSRIRGGVPTCRVLIFAGARDDVALATAIEAGASGYLPQECPLADVVAAIHAVHRGDMLVPPNMLGDLIERLSGRRNDREHARHVLSALTRREAEVLTLLARGADNEAMAERLFISPQTARTHVQNVLAKLGVHSRLEATAFVNRNGLLEELEAATTRQATTLRVFDAAGAASRRRRHAAAARSHPINQLPGTGWAIPALP